MGYRSMNKVNYPLPKHQPDATIIQALPVQNTWYTVLDTTLNALVYGFYCYVQSTGETLEAKFTMDGVTYTGSQAAVASTGYGVTLSLAGLLSFSTSYETVKPTNPIYARSIKVELRKTTANGSGSLYGKVVYAKW